MFSEEEKSYIKKAYWRNETLVNVADELDCGRTTVTRRVKKWDLDRAWECDYLVTMLYVDYKYSTHEIANALNCGATTISRRLNEMGVGTRPSYKEHPPYFGLHPDGERGYEVIRHNGNFVYHHRLLAVAEYGIDGVRDKHIHHKNEIKWDNRPNNIEPLSPKEHMEKHSGGA